jgi:hypothetical protein
MSSPPPEPSRDPSSEVSVIEARGAIRTGRAIWILVISLGLAVVVVLGVWLLHSRGLSNVTHPQARDFSNRDIAAYNEGSPSARSSPGDAGAGNNQ